MKKGTTKDESFLIKLHEMSIARGGIDEEVDRYAIGKAIGQNDRGIDNIVNLLAQANFIKKKDDKSVYLTENGLRLVNTLLEERN